MSRWDKDEWDFSVGWVVFAAVVMLIAMLSDGSVSL
jgi:hypothetical protein